MPNRCEFFSYLKDESVSEKDCLHAIDVWIMNKMKAMDDYHDLYLKKEIFILADVFESFVSMCLEYSRLGPCHYFSNSGLSWDAMLEFNTTRDGIHIRYWSWMS